MIEHDDGRCARQRRRASHCAPFFNHMLSVARGKISYLHTTVLPNNMAYAVAAAPSPCQQAFLWQPALATGHTAAANLAINVLAFGGNDGAARRNRHRGAFQSAM